MADAAAAATAKATALEAENAELRNTIAELRAERAAEEERCAAASDSK